VIAHRGASAVAPEHTIAAYDKAVEQGADYIELDVQRTKDGVLIVIHDATLDRTARGPAASCTGIVGQKTLAEIESCDVGSWFNELFPSLARPEFVGLRVPTLEQILSRYSSTARFYIETKDPDLYPGIESDILALLAKHAIVPGSVWPPRIFIESFSASSLTAIHSLDASLPLVQLFAAVTSPAVVSQLEQVQSYATAIGPIASAVTAQLVDAAHARCLLVHPYVVDNSAEMLSLLAVGVDGIFTDRPDLLREMINSSPAGRAGDSGCPAAR
jgi:glycerophosphoryl diester phosphodiesterase